MTDLPIEPEAKAVNILFENSLAEYNHTISFFYMHLQKLNSNVFLVEKILDFPRVFSCADVDGLLQIDFFLRCFVENAMETSILTITKLVKEKSRVSMNGMIDFQNKIIDFIKPEYRLASKIILEKTQFDQQMLDILNKATILRDKRIAHFDQKYFREFRVGGSDLTIDLTSLLPEIKALCGQLNFLFQDISFIGGKFGLNLYEYLYTHSDLGSPDIEVVLDGIAKHSFILSLPESNLPRWREIMDTRREQLPQFNHYRKKFGMTEVYL